MIYFEKKLNSDLKKPAFDFWSDLYLVGLPVVRSLEVYISFLICNLR